MPSPNIAIPEIIMDMREPIDKDGLLPISINSNVEISSFEFKVINDFDSSQGLAFEWVELGDFEDASNFTEASSQKNQGIIRVIPLAESLIDPGNDIPLVLVNFGASNADVYACAIDIVFRGSRGEKLNVKVLCGKN